MFRLAVAGAHMSGLPLNHQLTELGAKLVGPVKTAAVYRMYDLGPKPSLIRQMQGQKGHAFEIEVWEVPVEKVGTFIECAAPLPARSLACALRHAMRCTTTPFLCSTNAGQGGKTRCL